MPGVDSNGGTKRHAAFRAWLAMMDYAVDEDFLVFDVEGMPEDPFTEEGLRVAESAALRRFPDHHRALASENRELADKFVRFIGEVFVRSLGGTWTDDAQDGTDRAYLGVRFTGIDGSITPPTLLTAAMKRRTGEEWAFVYRHKARDLANG